MPLAGSRRQACQEGGRQLPVGSLMNDHLNYAKAAKAAKAEAGSIRWYDWLNDSTVIRNCGGDKYRLQLEQATGRCLLLLHFSCSALLMYSNRALSAATHALTHVQTRTHTHVQTHLHSLLCFQLGLLCFFFCSVPISGYYGNKQINGLSPSRSHCHSPSPSPFAACSSLFICFLCSCFH